MQLPGSCHCANITFTLTWEPSPAEIPARACGCTFCARHGGVWTSWRDGVLEVVLAAPDLVSRYAFGTRTAEFLVCARCGVVPVVTSAVDERVYAVVNVNTFVGIDPARIRRAPARFDDEDAAARLARRARTWIADVRIGGPTRDT